MSYKRTIDAASEPVTLAQAKRYLREVVVDADNDADISRQIKAARLLCEERLQRTLITSTWQLTLDGFPPAIKLPMPRLIAVSSLAYIDSAGAAQTMNSADYLVDSLSEPGYLVPAYGLSWPSTQDRINTVTVTYTAGYGADASAVPEPLKDWILAALLWRKDHPEEDLPWDFCAGLLDAYTIRGF